MSFIDTFKLGGNISFKGMRDAALSLLPEDKRERDRLYNDLERGIGILDDDDHLNMYLNSFGKMHKAKLDEAFRCLPNPSQLFSTAVEIYDWGCGQGIATICLLDFLKAKKIIADIRDIHLIDPSTAAVDRATRVIACYDNYEVHQITKVFDKLSTIDLPHTDTRKIHLFSNILDVDLFDLAQFTHLFQQCFAGENYIVCVGPYYSNNKRVDDFNAAIGPDFTYAVSNKEKGEWQNEWTISLRVFFKNILRIETIQDIRKRIEESHKKDQFFAGYILDPIASEYKNTETGEEAERLYNSLASFDVKSNIPLGKNMVCDSKLAVLANIISRGLPTRAPIIVEDLFSELFGISVKPKEDNPIEYISTHKLSAETINEALHVIDPRLNVDNYNGDMLESSFEKTFIEHYLKGTPAEYLIQILEPQRPLSTIVNIPDKKFSKDQRVDFALEIPYGGQRTGFILEMDGRQYHSNLFQRIYDGNRDRMTSHSGWDTYRIEQIQDTRFLSGWETETSASLYLSRLKKNYSKKLSGSWNDALQIVLSPLAIARVERMMVEAMMSGVLDIKAKEWNIIVNERDVPCAAVALKVFEEKYEQICKLVGESVRLPEIQLTIVSTAEFKNSPLHLNYNVLDKIPGKHFNLCLDISVLLRDNIDALPLNVNADAIYIIRSSHYKKRERTVCTADNIQYPPFVKKDSTGSYENIKEREETLTYFLREIFRKPFFRPGQLPILSRALSDKTTIGLLPTGGGKSLTYQLSSLLQPGVTIIVDPLVSLMVDQVRGMKEMRIDTCECVHSGGMELKERTKKLNLLQNGAVMFMLLSPERYMMENFRENLITMTEKNDVFFSYGVIDEVHCVSEWGHDFRTSYLHLGRNMINFMKTKSGRPLSIIGLTATASFDVLADVERELTLGGNLTMDSETIVRPENDSRPELTYRIVKVESNYDELRDASAPYILKAESEWDLKDLVASAKQRVMNRLFDAIPLEINALNSKHDLCHIDGFEPEQFYLSDEHGKYLNAGILFCPHARGTFGVLDNIWGTRTGLSSSLIAGHRNLAIGTFIGGDKPSGDMKLFNENDENLMVATKAFGMGIDKPNIRYTLHFNHPSSIESYVQEAGRGGRDRKHAISYVLYEPTEYVQLTPDKINDIRYYMGVGNDPIWLENYNWKFVLLEDFYDLCIKNNATEEQTKAIINILKNHGFVENVDKNIDLYFHNNSFRGLYKEKVILLEMTDRILNVKPSQIIEVQGRLRDLTGNSDVCLKVNLNRNSVTIFSEEDSSQQYGYVFLDTLTPTYQYLNYDRATCQYISQCLIEILKDYDDHSAKALLQPLEGGDNITEGIYSAMEHADADGVAYVTVSWENQVKQDPEQFERNIKAEISNISQSQSWNDLNEERYGTIKLNKVGDFNELLSQIARCSGDTRWLRNHGNDRIYNNLRLCFSKKRDKDDTDKAIYRMCCIGLVEDVTINYLAQTYELKIRKRTDEEFKQNMLEFFRKYYSLEQAQERVKQIDEQKGRNYLDKCLGYLTSFVYQSLEKKRFRAIEDMRIACEDSIQRGNEGAEWLKEFIHLYFNSKYARSDYKVNDVLYSLSVDTGPESKIEDFDVVEKYIKVLNSDPSGSEVENAKHLYGATLLCLRDHPDNAALQLLLCFCISFLGAGLNETLKSNAINSYVDGFLSIYKTKNNMVWEYIDNFNIYLATKVRQDDDFIKESLIKKGKETVVLIIHEERLKQIADRYLG